MKKFSIELANRLRSRLFKRVTRDHKVRYDPIDNRSEDFAKLTWAVHGVCLACRCWCITVGRCPECDIDYSGTRNWGEATEMVQRHITLAEQILA